MRTAQEWALEFEAFVDGLRPDIVERIQADAVSEPHALLNSKEVAWTSHPGPWRDARDAWNESVKGLIK